VAVTMPRPLGVVFEYDEARKRVVVADTIPGSHADQRAKVPKRGARSLGRQAGAAGRRSGAAAAPAGSALRGR
jgi:hypothetical protein